MAAEAKLATTGDGGLLGELFQWLLSLEPAFAFLLALPFVVSFAGLLSEYLRRRRAGAISRNSSFHHE